MLLVSLLSTIQLQVTKCSPIRPPRSSITAIDRQSPLYAPRLMPVKLQARCPSRRENWQATTIPRAYFTSALDPTPMATENPLPSQTHRRRQACVTLPNITGTAQPSAARSVTDDLVSPATMSAEQPSAQGSALTASGSVGTTTADGCITLRPPDDRKPTPRRPTDDESARPRERRLR